MHTPHHLDEAGVNRVMIVPGSWESDRIDYVLQACEAYPELFGAIARIPQNKPDEAKAMLRALGKQDDLLGGYLVATTDFTPACKKLAEESQGKLALVSGPELVRHLHIWGMKG